MLMLINSYILEILCPVLPNITDGVVIITSRLVDSLAIYNCSAGFEVVGIDVRVCLENGSWNGTEPICKGLIRQTAITRTIHPRNFNA